MRKSTLVMLSFLALFSYTAKAQDPVPTTPNISEENPFSMDVSLNSDIFFGFYPFFSGAYKLNKSTSFTFYGILWSGGTGRNWGNWTEFGVGIGFSPAAGLNINPQIGLLNGSLTSGLGIPTLAEGIVPNITIGLDRDKVEGEIYGGYYLGFDHGNPTTNNYLHYWVNGGYKLTRFFSSGLHFEHLRFMGGKGYESDAAYDYYAVVGPYVQFANPKGGAYSRFIGAWDLRSDEQVTRSGWDASSFFKLSVGYSF